MIDSTSVTSPTLTLTSFTSKKQSETLLQSGGRFCSQRIVPPIWRKKKIQFRTFPHFCGNNPLPAETPRTFATASADSGIVPHFCRNNPLPAEMPCTFATVIRWQRKRPALLQEHSATSRLLLHFCRRVLRLLLEKIHAVCAQQSILNYLLSIF